MAGDKGAKKSMGDQSGEQVTHDEGKADADNHGWAPDIDSPEGQQASVDSGARGDAPQPGGGQKDSDAPPSGTGESTTRRGEDIREADGKEAGRHDTGTAGAAQRPTGTSDPEDDTGVGAQGTGDDESPNLPTGDGGG